MEIAMLTGMNLMFYAVPIMMFTVIGLGLVRSLKEWNKNEHSPKIAVDVQVVGKRADVRRTMGNKTHVHRHSGMNYFATFQFDTGDRMELELSGEAYGLIVEGDRGKLTFQGTRFLGFERKQ